jgi:hypothetical protein
MLFPDSFPVADYDILQVPMQKHAGSRGWKIWNMGWKGLAYRYRMAVENQATFADAIQGPEDGEKRFTQERSFFDLVVSSLSTLSCYSYGLYALISLSDPAAFPIATTRDLRVYPEDVLRKLTGTGSPFQHEGITTTLSACLTSSRHAELKELRNALDHRGIPGRSIAVGKSDKIPNDLQDLPENWVVNRVFDAAFSKDIIEWLTLQVSELVGAAALFAKTHV